MCMCAHKHIAIGVKYLVRIVTFIFPPVKFYLSLVRPNKHSPKQRDAINIFNLASHKEYITTKLSQDSSAFSARTDILQSSVFKSFELMIFSPSKQHLSKIFV